MYIYMTTVYPIGFMVLLYMVCHGSHHSPVMLVDRHHGSYGMIISTCKRCGAQMDLRSAGAQLQARTGNRFNR